MFSYREWDVRYAFAIAIVVVLFLDLFFRIRLVIGKHYYGNKNWNRQARVYAAFGTLYLLLPLVWTYSDKIFKYYGQDTVELQSFFGFDKMLIICTSIYNLFLGFL